MRQALFRLSLTLAIAASLIVLAWSAIPAEGMTRWAPIVGLIGTLILSFISAVILRAGAEWVERIDVRYTDAYATMLLCGIATLVLGVALREALGTALELDSEQALRFALVLTTLLAFPIHSGIIGARLGIPFRRACLVFLVMLLVSAALALCVTALAYLIIWGYRRAGVL